MNRVQIRQKNPGTDRPQAGITKKLKEFLGRNTAACVTMLALFAVCSVALTAGRMKTYASADGTVYLSEFIDAAKTGHDFSDQVCLFRAEYSSSVQSGDGAGVIAPGTAGTYRLNVNNNTDQDLYYGFRVYAEVLHNPVRNGEPLKLPVQLTVTGCGREQVPVGPDGHVFSNGYSIKRGKTDSFVFAWKWDFETGDNGADTLWGNAAASDDPEKVPVMDVSVELYVGRDRTAYIVTFDPGEGVLIGRNTSTVFNGAPYGDMPGAARDGYRFLGWHTAEGQPVTPEMTVCGLTEDIILYAVYGENPDDFHTVTFDPGEGQLLGSGQKRVKNGEPYGQLPAAEVSGGKVFCGWYRKPGGKGERIERDTIVELTEDITVYAYYKYQEYVSGKEDEDPGPVRYGVPGRGAAVSSGDWELVDAEQKNWVFHGKNRYASSGWFYIKNPYSKGGTGVLQWFHFNEQGLMDKGWIRAGENDWYHLREISDGDLGSMEKGWYHDVQDGKTYYLDPLTGIMRCGWQGIDGKWYYFAGESDVTGNSWVLDTGRTDDVARWVFVTGERSYGSMFAGEMTPDGHYVMADGSWDGKGRQPETECKEIGQELP